MSTPGGNFANTAFSTHVTGVTMTSRSNYDSLTPRGSINPWIEKASYRGKLMPHVTFGFADPETWPVVSITVTITNSLFGHMNQQ